MLGVPSNDFGAQEPGSEAEIKQVCSRKFNVTVPMTSKVSVKGSARAPLYQYLGDKAGAPGWNASVGCGRCDSTKAPGTPPNRP